MSRDSKGKHGAVPGNPMAIGSKLAPCSVVVELVPPTASTGQGGDLARRRYQKGQILFSKSRQLWLGRYREDTIRPDGSVIRARPQIVLGTKKELPTQRLAARKLDEILSRINDCAYQPTRIATVADFCGPLARGSSRKAKTVNGAIRQLPSRLSHSSAAGEAPPRPGGPREPTGVCQPTCRRVEKNRAEYSDHALINARDR